MFTKVMVELLQVGSTSPLPFCRRSSSIRDVRQRSPLMLDRTQTGRAGYSIGSASSIVVVASEVKVPPGLTRRPRPVKPIVPFTGVPITP